MVIGKEAKINADLIAEEIIVKGDVVGDITAKKSIHLTKKANVTGKIESKDVAIESGAKAYGVIKITD